MAKKRKHYDVDTLVAHAEEFIEMLSKYAELRTKMDPEWKLKYVDDEHSFWFFNDHIDVKWIVCWCGDWRRYTESIPIAHLKTRDWRKAIQKAMADREEERKRQIVLRKQLEEEIRRKAHEKTREEEIALLKQLQEKYGKTLTE